MYRQPSNDSPHHFVDLYNELRLWASVLELAVRDYLLGNDELMFEATYWIFDAVPDLHFNSFDNLCFTLDLDPDAVRDRLKKMNGRMYKKYVTDMQHSRRSIAYR